MTGALTLDRLGGLLRPLSVLLLLAIWSAAALIAQSHLLPTPWAVAASLYRHTVHGALLFHLGMTLMRVAASFLVAMAAGVVIGILMGERRGLDRLFDSWVVLGLNIPALVLMILCYVWLGLTEAAAILAVALNKLPIVVVTVREGARAVDRDLLQVAEVLRLGTRRRLAKVYLPQLYPYFMVAARNGLALVWKIVLVAELIGRSNGVGFQLGVYFQYFDITSILAYTFAFVAVVAVVEGLILAPLERRLAGWRR
jgi:ABC-type nitrate/sulfonate/bicarbonate transport system permease component